MLPERQSSMWEVCVSTGYKVLAQLLAQMAYISEGAVEVPPCRKAESLANFFYKIMVQPLAI